MSDSFSEFYKTHVTTVRRVMYRMGLDSDLDDGVQDCFVKAWKGLTSQGAASFSGKSQVTTWVTRIAVNTAIDYLRRRNRNITDATDHENFVDQSSTAQSGIEASEIVRKLLKRLKPESRSVLILSVMEGFTAEEISEILEIPPGTVKSRLHTAKKESEAELLRLGVRL